MKKAWKWVVGVVASLVGVCFLGVVGLGIFGMLGRMMSGSMRWGSEMHRGYGSQPYGYGPGFGMHGFGLMPMAGLGGLFGFGLFVLVIIGVGLGVFALVTTLRKTQTPGVQTSGAAAPAATGIDTTSSGQSAATLTCKACGKNVDSGWVACPYCGEKV